MSDPRRRVLPVRRPNFHFPAGGGDPNALKLPEASATLETFWRADTVSTTGSLIDSATDKSGNGRTASAAGGARPTLVTSGGPNDQPYMEFDGTSDALTTSSFTISQPLSIMLVMNSDTWTNGERILDGVAADRCVLAQLGASPGHQLYAGSAFACLTNITLAQWNVVMIEFNGASSRIRVNQGSVGASGNPGSTGITDGVTLGAKWGPTAFCDVHIAEARYFSGALSTTDRAYLETYASDRYGITLV